MSPIETQLWEEEAVTNPLSAEVVSLNEAGGSLFRAIAETEMVSGGHERPQLNLVLAEQSEWAFFTNMFRWHGTALKEIVPQIIWVLFVVSVNTTLIARNVYYFKMDNADDSRTNQMFTLTGSVVGILLVFRSGQAYTNYREGRLILGNIANCMRQITQLAYTYPPAIGADQQRMTQLRVVLRRKLLLLHALCRQEIREFKHGFVPGCSIEGLPFEENWHRDPCCPPIGRLISEQEKCILDKIACVNRPAFVQAELNQLGGELSMLYANGGHVFVHKFYRETSLMMDHYQDALRITNTKVPLPYLHLLYLACFLMTTVYALLSSTSIGSSEDDTWTHKFESMSGWVGSCLLTLSSYGILEIAAKLQDPFGHDEIDHDMEEFSVRANNECQQVAFYSGAGDCIDYNTGDFGATPEFARRATWRSRGISDANMKQYSMLAKEEEKAEEKVEQARSVTASVDTFEVESDH